MMMYRQIVVALALWMLSVAGIAASSLEKELNQRWQASWVIVAPEVFSNCDGHFSNNDVIEQRIASKANHSLPPGELAKVIKLDVKRKRVDVLLEVREHILVGRQEGPFQLFDDLACKVELRFFVGRSLIKSRDKNAIEERLAAVLSRFQNEAEATSFSGYNRRKRADLPPDYDRVLRDYEAWAREQFNLQVEERLRESSLEAYRLTRSVSDDAEYSQGFAKGLRAMNALRLGNCQRALDSQFYSVRKRPPSSQSERWEEGFEDGQRLGYLVTVNQHLQDCFQ